MIRYNPQSWTKVLLGFAQSPVFRTLFLDVVGVAIYAALVVWLERDVGKIPQPFGLPVLSLLGIILGLLLVFRTNTAYDRWWEGRRLWGQLVNNSRALSRQLHAMLPPGRERRSLYAKLIAGFAATLAQHLRAFPPSHKARDLDPVDRAAETQGELAIAKVAELLANAPHRPNRLLSHLTQEFHSDVRAGNLPHESVIALQPLLTAFDDVTGACERISRTPIPFGYSSYIKQFIVLFTLVVPFAMAKDYGYGTVVAAMFLFFSTMGLELLATEIEEPFGSDRNDLPLFEIAKRIGDDVADLLPSER
ncbi:MAG: bestrophin family protein [Deltaproteobacteria bacterium]|nr:bestrophin family protein [Deltaproteobacteria bacterium]